MWRGYRWFRTGKKNRDESPEVAVGMAVNMESVVSGERVVETEAVSVSLHARDGRESNTINTMMYNQRPES